MVQIILVWQLSVCSSEWRGIISIRTEVQYGVLQGTVLSLLILALYILPLGNIIRKYGVSFHCYADNTQLYNSWRPDEKYTAQN